MPVILNPETMGCGFLFAVKILARNVVNQSERCDLCYPNKASLGRVFN